MRKEEKEFIDYIKSKCESPLVLIDVGANLGKYSNYFNDNVDTKNTYLFEPIKSCYDKIEKREGYKKYNMGVGSTKGVSVFYEAEGKESHSSIVNREWLYSKPEYKITKKNIEIDTLDNHFDENIEVLKIDTEGYELEVLKGATELLKNKKIDYIQFEYGGCFKDNNITLNNVIDFLSQFGYYVYELTDNKFTQIKNYKDDYRWVNFFSTYKDI